MKKARNRDKNASNHLGEIDKSVQSISKNAEKIAEGIDIIANDAKSPEKTFLARLAIVVAILTLIVTAIGVLNDNKDSPVSQSEYKIYLSSEYTTLKVTAATDITAALNFDANSVSLSAYLDSVADGDTLLMTRNNETEWHKKVYFEHLGTYEVIATAVTPDGETVEASLGIKVIP